MEAFTKVIDMAPGYAEGWNTRATTLCALGQMQRAIADCQKALELKPRHFGCLSSLGMCHLGLGDKEGAARWLQAALDVHPDLPGATDLLEQMKLQDLVDEHLQPRMDRIKIVFEVGAQASAESRGASSWDVHRVRMDGQDDGVWAYFFRVNIRSPTGTQSAMQSRARFYVLQAVDGKVFDFARGLRGDDSVRIEPGVDHKVCWILIVGRELRSVAAGNLLEHLREVEQPRYVTEDLPVLSPREAPEVDREETAKLGEGYLYSGQLDLRVVGGF